jgi:hypothetical protein
MRIAVLVSTVLFAWLSADGRYQTACEYPGYIYVSSDFGATWGAKGDSHRYRGVAMSADGAYQTVTTSKDHDRLYTSSPTPQ